MNAALIAPILIIVSLLGATRAFALGHTNSERCDPVERSMTPCKCCKIDCWFDVIGEWQARLGHQVGDGSPMESELVLLHILGCKSGNCADQCAAPSSAALLLVPVQQQ